MLDQQDSYIGGDTGDRARLGGSKIGINIREI